MYMCIISTHVLFYEYLNFVKHPKLYDDVIMMYKCRTEIIKAL